MNKPTNKKKVNLSRRHFTRESRENEKKKNGDFKINQTWLNNIWNDFGCFRHYFPTATHQLNIPINEKFYIY